MLLLNVVAHSLVQCYWKLSSNIGLVNMLIRIQRRSFMTQSYISPNLFSDSCLLATSSLSSSWCARRCWSRPTPARTLSATRPSWSRWSYFSASARVTTSTSSFPPSSKSRSSDSVERSKRQSFEPCACRLIYSIFKFSANSKLLLLLYYD